MTDSEIAWDPGIPEAYRAQVLEGDCRELSVELPDESVDLIYTDPPYPREFDHLWWDLGEWAPRILRPGGSLITLCGHYQVPMVLEALGRGLDFNWIGWVFHPGPKVSLRAKWIVAGGKPQIWMSKGTPRWDIHNGPFWDTKSSGNRDKRFHEWGQPTSYVIRDLQTLLSPDSVVLDPFCGGGNLPASCITIGHPFWMAWDIDPEAVQVTKRRLDLAQLPLITDVPPPQLSMIQE